MDKRFCVLIPAYKPTDGLIELVREIRRNTSCAIIVIDDGSGKEFRGIFESIKGINDCYIISYEVNGGKGHAMKKGFRLYQELYADDKDFSGVVTADADGQHLLKDILNIGNLLSENTNELILGVRSFRKDVPLRSKFGNNTTIFVYRLASGIKVSDTQTGLRGIPHRFVEDMISLDGERYEYEMTMLLEVKNLNMTIKEVPIETVYIDDNSGSHFSTIRDSYKIYKIIIKKTYAIKFMLAAILSSLLEYIIYAALISFTVISATVAQIPSRTISAVFNFILNKKVVFSDTYKTKSSYLWQAVLYFALAVFNLFAIAIPLNDLFINIGVNEYISVLLANGIQFVINYFIQKYLIFRKVKKK